VARRPSKAKAIRADRPAATTARKGQSTERSKVVGTPLEQTAAAVGVGSEEDSQIGGTLLAFVPLLVLGLLLVGITALPPARIPWPVIAEPLYLHRPNLAAIGFGAIALAFLVLNAAVLL